MMTLTQTTPWDPNQTIPLFAKAERPPGGGGIGTKKKPTKKTKSSGGGGTKKKPAKGK